MRQKRDMTSTAELTFDEKYDVLGTKNTEYDGVFFTAVKTTGIFCRPSCRARKPLAKNVEFYPDAAGATAGGYRPCKICTPLKPVGYPPEEVRRVLELLRSQPSLRVRDEDLRNIGVAPSTIRRWFKANHGMTFQAYQRTIRVNLGHQQITSGKSVTTTAFSSGYESLSGFGNAYQKLFSASPSKATGITVVLERIPTELGVMFGCATERGICMLEFHDRKNIEKQFEVMRKHIGAVLVPGTNAHLTRLKSELSLYLRGELQEFTVPLDAPGTDFQQDVWRALRNVPYGKTCTYGDQARTMGRPKAVRAVANANGKNRIAIIIPCHRVIGGDGKLTGYAGGLPRKKWLLEMERNAMTRRAES